MRLRLGWVLGAIGLWAGCRASPDGAVSRVRRELDSQRQGAALEVERKLAHLDGKMEELRAAARSAGARKQAVMRSLRQLEQEQAQLRKSLERARRSGDRALEDLGQSVDRTMERIEQTLGLSEEAPRDQRPAGA
jgi:chromosome segregation ATPase